MRPAGRSRETPPRRSSALWFTLAICLGLAIGLTALLPIHPRIEIYTLGPRRHDLSHLCAFIPMAFLLVRAPSSDRGRFFAFAAALLFGWSVEYGEHLVFHTNVEWHDILVNGIAVIAGAVLATLSLLLPRRTQAVHSQLS